MGGSNACSAVEHYNNQIGIEADLNAKWGTIVQAGVSAGSAAGAEAAGSGHCIPRNYRHSGYALVVPPSHNVACPMQCCAFHYMMDPLSTVWLYPFETLASCILP